MENFILGVAALAQVAPEQLEGLKNAETNEYDLNALLPIIQNGFKSKYESLQKDVLGRAKREALTEAEKALMQQYSVAEKLPISELVAKIVSNSVEAARIEERKAAKLDISALTEDTIAELPLFKEMRDKSINVYKTEAEQAKKAYEDFVKNFEETQRKTSIVSTIRNEFIALNPFFSPEMSPEQKENAINMFISSINLDEIEKTDSGEFRILKSDGTYEKDDSYNPLTLKDFLKKKYPFGFNKVTTTQNLPNPNNQGLNAKAIDVKGVKDANEAWERFYAETDPIKKAEWSKFISSEGWKTAN